MKPRNRVPIQISTAVFFDSLSGVSINSSISAPRVVKPEYYVRSPACPTGTRKGSARRALGAFGPEGLAHGVVGFQVGAAYQVYAIGHGGEDARHGLRAVGVLQPFQRFGDRFGLTGQVEDQTFAPYHRALARQDGRGH